MAYKASLKQKDECAEGPPPPRVCSLFLRNESAEEEVRRVDRLSP